MKFFYRSFLNSALIRTHNHPFKKATPTQTHPKKLQQPYPTQKIPINSHPPQQIYTKKSNLNSHNLKQVTTTHSHPKTTPTLTHQERSYMHPGTAEFECLANNYQTNAIKNRL